MSVDLKSVDLMSVDLMSVNLMSVDYMSVDLMCQSWGQCYKIPNFRTTDIFSVFL